MYNACPIHARTYTYIYTYTHAETLAKETSRDGGGGEEGNEQGERGADDHGISPPLPPPSCFVEKSGIPYHGLFVRPYVYVCVCVCAEIYIEHTFRVGEKLEAAKILLPLHSLEFHLFFPTLLSSRARTEWKFCVAILVQFVTKVGIPIDPFFDASQRNSLEQNGTEQNETVTVRT